MKYRYITPEIETLEMLLGYGLLEDSSLVNYYGGDDVDPIDGQW